MTDLCPFCPMPVDRIEFRWGSVVAFRDGFPVSEGHYLIVPQRHVPNYLEMTSSEAIDTFRLLREISSDLMDADDTIEGFNIGMNCGVAAGQTVPHAHTHLIPRRHGDIPNPRGGVRGVIPSKMSYDAH